MKLTIDGREVTVRADQSLLDIIKEMGLVTGKLSTDPIAAKIAGDIFTLNYIPLREKDVRPDSERVREAVAASGGVVRLVRDGSDDHEGNAVAVRCMGNGRALHFRANSLRVRDDFFLLLFAANELIAAGNSADLRMARIDAFRRSQSMAHHLPIRGKRGHFKTWHLSHMRRVSSMMEYISSLVRGLK